MVCFRRKVHGVNQLRVIGGVCDCWIKAGMQFYDARNNDITNTTIGFTNPITSNSIDGNNHNYDDNNGNENKNKQKSLDIRRIQYQKYKSLKQQK